MGQGQELVGQRFARLTVISLAPRPWRGTNRQWVCRCDCGNKIDCSGDRLKSGNTRSCGCLHREELAERNRTNAKHGHASNGRTTREYGSWHAMRQRCLNPTDPAYHYYGGLGVTICERWLESFANFYEDMGERPPGTSLDRIDPWGNYEPNNCRWADAATQTTNTRRRAQKAVGIA